MLETTITKPEQGRCIIAFKGRLDTATTPTAELKILPALQAPGLKVVVLDMERLDFISSMGLRLIFKMRKELAAQNKTLLMIKLQPQIAKVFEIAAALPKETVFANLAEADRYFAAMQRKEIEKQGPKT